MTFKLSPSTFKAISGINRLISLISYIITNLQGTHAPLSIIFLMFRAITSFVVLVHFQFQHHKYIILFLFTFVELKHSPLSDVILRL